MNDIDKVNLYLKTIANDNRNHLLLSILKEQYELGDITKEEYSASLKAMKMNITRK